MNFQRYKKQILTDPKFKKEYKKFDLIFEIKELFFRIRLYLACKKSNKLTKEMQKFIKKIKDYEP